MKYTSTAASGGGRRAKRSPHNTLGLRVPETPPFELQVGSGGVLVLGATCGPRIPASSLCWETDSRPARLGYWTRTEAGEFRADTCCCRADTCCCRADTCCCEDLSILRPRFDNSVRALGACVGGPATQVEAPHVDGRRGKCVSWMDYHC
jgi:hypothetical protein